MIFYLKVIFLVHLCLYCWKDSGDATGKHRAEERGMGLAKDCESKCILFTQLSVPAGFKKCLTIQLETFPPASGSFMFLPTAQRNVEPIDLAVETQRLTGTNYRLTSWGLCNISPPGVEARSKTNLIKNGTSLSTFNLHIGHSVDALIQGELQGQSPTE